MFNKKFMIIAIITAVICIVVSYVIIAPAAQERATVEAINQANEAFMPFMK